MRAVNLIPAEEARAAGGGGRSGGAAYAVLGVLALAVVMVSGWAFLSQTLSQRQADAARVEAQAATAEAKAASLKSFTEFSALRQKRTETVRQLADSRFDWPHALRDVARTVPAKAWVTSLRATVAPTVSVDGTADPLRQALTVPAIEVAGCATSQEQVANTVAAMRRIDDVQRVSLSSSAVDGGSADTASACGGPRFSMTVFFNAPEGQAATGASPATAATTGGSTP
jgi:Tfp pilus assembly protein PilN